MNPRKDTLRAAGLMSGTSADGIDAAIVEIRYGPGGRTFLSDTGGRTFLSDKDGRASIPACHRRQGETGRNVCPPIQHVRLLAHHTVRYPRAVREAVFRLFDPETARIDELCRVNFEIGELFAKAVLSLCRRSRIPVTSLDVIGSHGQTVQHLPEAKGKSSTLQIGEPSIIAERTGVTTVADFRPRDVAAGGEGAPLVPYADWGLFAGDKLGRAVQNIGGIANVTFLPAGAALDDVLAFDTGPGNMIIDRVAWRLTGGKKTYDAGGKLAAKGRVDEPLLARLMKDPYLRRTPPKSTGRETFGIAFADALWERARKEDLRGEDLLATVTAFTARSIAEAYRRHLGKLDEVILCGGGAHNRTLVRMLTEALGGVRLVPMKRFGIDPDAKEAVSFALLAAATLRGEPANLPPATGAAHRVVLGKIIPGKLR